MYSKVQSTINKGKKNIRSKHKTTAFYTAHFFYKMEDITEVNYQEKPHSFVSTIMEPRLKANPCECRQRGFQVFSNRCALVYVFPVCAIVASLVLASLAFKTSRPGVLLGLSFLLFILAIIYCVVANTVRFCLPDSETGERRSDHFDSQSDKINTTVVVSL